MEKMTDFFAARVAEYDEHMLTEVGGCREAYIKMASLVPEGCKTLLDLGCGTGLELDEIFKIYPDISVTGIDLTHEMLDMLIKKHPDKSMTLICGNYFDVYLGVGKYDCAVSFQTMHHFSAEMKIALYAKIRDALTPGGLYIECDYMVETEKEQEHWFAENARLRKENNVPDGDFYHFDTPHSVDNMKKMLENSGFSTVEKVFRKENTTILISKT